MGDGGSRQRQVERLQKKAARLEQWLQENEPKIGDTGKEIQSNVTDNESAKMKTMHGATQGYNGQAVADGKHQIILHGEAFGKGQDSRHLRPMVDGAKQNMKRIGYSQDCLRGKRWLADADYHSMTNLATCVKEGLDAYIPDKMYRRRDPRLSPLRLTLQRENKYCLGACRNTLHKGRIPRRLFYQRRILPFGFRVFEPSAPKSGNYRGAYWLISLCGTAGIADNRPFRLPETGNHCGTTSIHCV